MTGEPYEVGECRAEMVTGWRRFFALQYWQMRWLTWRLFGPFSSVEVRGVGTLTVPDELAEKLGLMDPEEEPACPKK
jgi:hypothetical protein